MMALAGVDLQTLFSEPDALTKTSTKATAPLLVESSLQSFTEVRGV